MAASHRIDTIFSSLNRLTFMIHLVEPLSQIFTDPKIPGQVNYPDAERKKIAVKMVDIFGNDTMTIMEVSPGKADV
jgi:hypothetical protein